MLGNGFQYYFVFCHIIKRFGSKCRNVKKWKFMGNPWLDFQNMENINMQFKNESIMKTIANYLLFSLMYRNPSHPTTFRAPPAESVCACVAFLGSLCDAAEDACCCLVLPLLPARVVLLLCEPRCALWVALGPACRAQCQHSWKPRRMVGCCWGGSRRQERWFLSSSTLKAVCSLFQAWVRARELPPTAGR